MGVVAGANEAEQTQPGAEQTPRKPEATSERASETATATAADPTTKAGAETTAGTTAEPATEQAKLEQVEQTPQAPGFGERGRMRRRARFLRKARELAYRDLGGLVFDLHRFGQRNDQLVLAKLATLRQIDTELRELEHALDDRRPVTVLREVGIAACPRCAAIHGSDDRFCPGCGLAFDTNADRPISTAPVRPPAPTSTVAQGPTKGESPGGTPTSASHESPATPPTPTPRERPNGTPTPASRESPATPPTPTPRESPGSTPTPASRESLAASAAPALPPKPTATPIAAKPTAPVAEPKPEERAAPDRPEEDEPTQILRPPTTGP